MSKLLCSNLCLFGAIIELHAMDEDLLNCHWKMKVEFICNKGLFESYFIFYIWSGGIYHHSFEKLGIMHDFIL